MRIGVGRLGSLDPAQARTVDEQLVAEQLFGRLTSYDAQNLEPTSGLASHWRYSLDQRSWSFFLRPDARFANGRAITSLTFTRAGSALSWSTRASVTSWMLPTGLPSCKTGNCEMPTDCSTCCVA